MAIDQLYEVADNDEKDVLDSLRLRAGLTWQCAPCGWINDPLLNKCENCAAPKPSAPIDQV